MTKRSDPMKKGIYKLSLLSGWFLLATLTLNIAGCGESKPAELTQAEKAVLLEQCMDAAQEARDNCKDSYLKCANQHAKSNLTCIRPYGDLNRATSGYTQPQWSASELDRRLA